MNMVSEKVITKLGVEPPSHQMVDSYMAIIAENYNVPYERDPTAAFVSSKSTKKSCVNCTYMYVNTVLSQIVAWT